ncbi:peptide chain release factor N(5)-glutamine methyltransferase [Candidatus Saccharibacteria bacterium]|nr:peptide chain release factor N(5)-glutamine methyltransferase [Candidatus Saccharibacteria bacterium]
MNVSSWLKRAATSQISHLDAELILAHALNKERVFLHAHPDYELTESEQKKAEDYLKRRQNHEPVAYILGSKEFYGREFAVTPDTLIPRPETEAIIDLVKELSLEKPKILDVGTGSGCIAITLKLELPESDVIAVDISEKALAVAEKNANNMHANLEFKKSDLLKNVDEKFDIIVANLPYVDKNWDWLSPELDFEPETALYSEDFGLKDIKNLILESNTKLAEQGKLILESDISQHEAIESFVKSNTNMRLVKTSGLAQMFEK